MMAAKSNCSAARSNSSSSAADDWLLASSLHSAVLQSPLCNSSRSFPARTSVLALQEIKILDCSISLALSHARECCSDCYRLERPLPGGTRTLSRTMPLNGTRLRLRLATGLRWWLRLLFHSQVECEGLHNCGARGDDIFSGHTAAPELR